MKLTDQECRDIKATNKPIKLSDWGGLFLFITPNGTKFWRHKYRINGKETQISYGQYPQISLNEARKHHKETKRLLSDGLDPMEIRREKKKLRPKPINKKKVFNLALSKEGEFTIETPNNFLRLSKSETQAIKSFLNAIDDGDIYETE